MHPELVKYTLPEFLSPYFGTQTLVLYTYAFCIISGTLLAVWYPKWQAKKELGIKHLSNNFFYLLFICGFVGGKLFYYLENPIHYVEHQEELLHNFSGGFVFYGSFIFIIPFVLWYLKKYKIAVLPMLDILAFTTLIVHAIGRFGCFNAGCCYGSPTDSFTGIVFPGSHHISVHPTQLYEIGVLGIIFLFLSILKQGIRLIAFFFT